jgi:hypothetical protein
MVLLMGKIRQFAATDSFLDLTATKAFDLKNCGGLAAEEFIPEGVVAERGKYGLCMGRKLGPSFFTGWLRIVRK